MMYILHVCKHKAGVKLIFIENSLSVRNYTWNSQQKRVGYFKDSLFSNRAQKMAPLTTVQFNDCQQTRMKTSPEAKNSLKSLKTINTPPIPAIFTPLTIRNGFLIKF